MSDWTLFHKLTNVASSAPSCHSLVMAEDASSRGNAARDQVRPDGERLEVAASFLRARNTVSCVGLRAGFEDGGGRSQLIVIDVAELARAVSRQSELLWRTARDDPRPSAFFAIPSIRLDRSGGPAGQRSRRSRSRAGWRTAVRVELGERVGLLRLRARRRGTRAPDPQRRERRANARPARTRERITTPILSRRS